MTGGLRANPTAPFEALAGQLPRRWIDYEGIRNGSPPRWSFRGKIQHRRSQYALSAAAMICAGVSPALLDEVIWRHANYLFVWSRYARVIYVGVAAERTDTAKRPRGVGQADHEQRDTAGSCLRRVGPGLVGPALEPGPRPSSAGSGPSA